MAIPTHDGVLSFEPDAPAESSHPQHVKQGEFDEAQAFARSAEAPEYLRRVQRNIDAGYYTWDDVVAGNLDDPAALRLKGEIDRFAIPYRQIGRWSEHGRDWDEVEAEMSPLITGITKKVGNNDATAGAIIIRPSADQSGIPQASTPWLTDAHLRALLQPNTKCREPEPHRAVESQ